MANEDRIIRLNAWKEKKDIAERTKEQLRIMHEAELKTNIEMLWDRAKALIDLYNASVDAGLTPPPSSFSDWEIRNNNFIAGGIYHRLGFGTYQPDRYGKIGSPYDLRYNSHADSISIRGGGYSVYEIDLCNGKLNYTGDGAIKRLEDFVEDFNEFETRFYDWFDRKTGGTA